MSQSMTIDQAMQAGIRHHSAGQLQQAEHIYRQILQAVPNHHDALHLMGVLALQIGRADAAIEYINHAISIQPTAALYHSNLSEAYRQM
jgi:tetratricopeptide (TPR) repeat protein